MATTSTVYPTPQHTTATIPLDKLAEMLAAQMMRERDLFLALVDERERLLGIEPRTAEIRKWWKERNNGDN